LKYSVAIDYKDATKILGTQYADLFVCDFPLFSFLRYVNNRRWEAELLRMTTQRPKAIIMTDGSSCRYHLQWKNYAKVDSQINDTRESYVYALSRLLHSRYGYSIAECAYHANSFYYRLEHKKPYEIQFKHFPAGSSKQGLRKIK
jgi:hypothetical protein